MSNAEMKLAEILGSGRKPTADDLEAALHSVLKERNALLAANKDMGTWMCKMAVARVAGDENVVLATLDEFMAKHIQLQVADNSSGRVH